MSAPAQNRVQIGCLGFFNYVITQHSVDIVAVACPTWHHNYHLSVNGQDYDLYDWDVQVVQGGSNSNTPINRIGQNLSAGLPPGHPAFSAWCNLNLIPRFTNMCDNVALSPNWRTRPSVVAALALGGGDIVAVGRPFSAQRLFGWIKNGVPITQPMSDGFLYLAPAGASLTLTLSAKKCGKTESITLTETPEYHPQVMLYAEPQNYPQMPSLDDENRLDLGHFLASLSLCDVSGDGPDWVARTPVTMPIPGPLPKFPPGPFNPVAFTNPTRVGCGARLFDE